MLLKRNIAFYLMLGPLSVLSCGGLDKGLLRVVEWGLTLFRGMGFIRVCVMVLGVSGRRSGSGRLLPGALTFPVVLELELMVFSEGSLQSVLSMALVGGGEQQ